jgi:hypothetical protein
MHFENSVSCAKCNPVRKLFKLRLYLKRVFMEVITIETESFYKLIQHVVERIKAEHKITEDRWISGTEAMRLLCISSKTTLQKLRDTGAVRYTQPKRKVILYDRNSILEYLEKNVKETF